MLIRIFYLILFLLSASITCSTEEDPEASELGQNYNIVIETKNLKAYDTSSSIDVVARIAQKEKEITLTEEATVKLVYMCKVNGNEESQQVELIIGKNSSSGTVSIDDLPVMQSEQNTLCNRSRS